MQKHKIGEEIIINQEFDIQGCFSDDLIQVKKGDKGYIDSNGFVHYITGKARGKIQKIANVEMKGYDTENIAKLIFDRIKTEYGIKEYLYAYDEKYIIEDINYILSEIF